MSVEIVDILDRIVSHAMTTGHFDRVNGFEPKNAPGSGVTAAVWVDGIAPARGGSGLASTTIRLTCRVRVYTAMLSEPQDAIDPAVVAAISDLCTAYSSDFDLGAEVRNIDLLGEYSEGMSAQAGYINMDGRLMRIMDLNLPLIINDVFTQSA